jgi:hypothetical protein
MDIHAFSFGSVFITFVYSQVYSLIPHLLATLYYFGSSYFRPTIKTTTDTDVSILTFRVQFHVAFCQIFYCAQPIKL